ncbi:MAG: PIN domain-containing protein [Thermomicrobiales bacterium]
MPARFLDANVLLRYFIRDDEEKAQRALALLQRVERGEERVETSLIVIFEVVFTLERTYNVPRARMYDLVKPVLELRGLTLPGKSLLLDTLDRYAMTSRKLSFVDLYVALNAQSRGISEIYSWDKDFDRIEGIRRVEPNDAGA